MDTQHFDGVKALLDEMSIPYSVDPWIVRGLDYYTRTVFEFISNDIGTFPSTSFSFFSFF